MWFRVTQDGWTGNSSGECLPYTTGVHVYPVGLTWAQVHTCLSVNSCCLKLKWLFYSHPHVPTSPVPASLSPRHFPGTASFLFSLSHSVYFLFCGRLWFSSGGPGWRQKQHPEPCFSAFRQVPLLDLTGPSGTTGPRLPGQSPVTPVVCHNCYSTLSILRISSLNDKFYGHPRGPWEEEWHSGLLLEAELCPWKTHEGLLTSTASEHDLS